jgi:nicotinate dehydrogenase subunit A
MVLQALSEQGAPHGSTAIPREERLKSNAKYREFIGCDGRVHISAITLNVNGTTHRLDVDPTTPLLYELSEDLQLRGPKFGCGLSQCGACTAIVNGDAVRRCVTPVSRVNGATISTLDGLGTAENPHPIQKAFIDEQAAQCGFCLNGVILTAKAFLDKTPKPSDAELHEAMSGVLCRCFAHQRMIRAIKRYAERTV